MVIHYMCRVQHWWWHGAASHLGGHGRVHHRHAAHGLLLISSGTRVTGLLLLLVTCTHLTLVMWTMMDLDKLRLYPWIGIMRSRLSRIMRNICKCRHQWRSNIIFISTLPSKLHCRYCYFQSWINCKHKDLQDWLTFEAQFVLIVGNGDDHHNDEEHHQQADCHTNYRSHGQGV